MLPVKAAGLREIFHLRVRPVVDIVLCWDAYCGVRELSWGALIMRWVDRGVTSLWGNGTGHLGVKARI